MKYIITGGCGFIGSFLAKSFINNDDAVVVIDDLSSGRIENIAEFRAHSLFTFFHSDVVSFSDWEAILNPGDIIIHLAATVGVNRVAQDAIYTLENNYRPTMLLLELARKHQCKFFFTSTSEVYGESSSERAKESNPLIVPGSLCGRSAYVLGKLISEQYCLEYYRKFGVPMIIARLFNVIGSRQSNKFGMVVPTFINQALCHEPITLFDDGLQTRSFCNIADMAIAIRGLLLEDKAWGETFNIGSTERVSMRELAQYIKVRTNSKSKIINIPFPVHRSEGRDIQHRSACINKITSLTGWQPNVHWKDSIDSIIEHHKKTFSTSFAL